VAGSSVGVENRVSLAQDGLGIKLNGFVIRLIAVRFVTSLLQFGGIVFTLFLSKARNGLLVDVGQLRLCLSRSRFGLGGAG